MRGPADSVWRATAAGLVVRVRLMPKASREAIEGTEPTAYGPALKVRVRSPPEDGAANAALVHLLAGWLGVPRSSVTLVAGQKSRVKSLAVAGDPAALAERIGALLRQDGKS